MFCRLIVHPKAVRLSFKIRVNAFDDVQQAQKHIQIHTKHTNINRYAFYPLQCNKYVNPYIPTQTPNQNYNDLISCAR